jgi:YHS domain-containing protein
MNKFMTSEAAKHETLMYTLCSLVLSLFIAAGVETATAGEPAIDGYDPVAYFEMVKAVKGSESISHEWLGKKWLFVNEDHKSLFSADPISYMPNYGGYCSYDPYKAGHDHIIDPTAWRIVDGELYLFFSEKKANHAVPAEKWAKVKAGLDQ